jgi:hypothetical protein
LRDDDAKTGFFQRRLQMALLFERSGIVGRGPNHCVRFDVAREPFDRRKQCSAAHDQTRAARRERSCQRPDRAAVERGSARRARDALARCGIENERRHDAAEARRLREPRMICYAKIARKKEERSYSDST